MAKAKPKTKTYVANVIDNSVSMRSIQEETRRAINGIQDSIRDGAIGQDVLVKTFYFGDHVSVGEDVKAENLRDVMYYPNESSTSLWDGIGTAIGKLMAKPDADEKHVSFLINVVTDGEENSSRTYTSADVADLMSKCNKTDRWTFAISLPKGSRARFLARFSIPAGNVREWETDGRGMAETQAVTSQGMTNYFVSRSAGHTKVDNFYLTTDLAKVTPTAIKRALDDVTSKVKIFDVKQEEVIAPFIERRTRKIYNVGSAFYLLMKTETIQPHKRVLIVEKGKPQVWGGDAARDLIGLTGSTTKVTPGNHSKYDIFVQSTSVNRKLPRGTKVAVMV